MKIDIVTIFPQLFPVFLETSLIGRARSRGLLEVTAHDLRDSSTDRHRSVDDAPYGGGSGMVLAAPAVFAAVEALRRRHPADAPPRVIVLSPQGRVLDQAKVKELATLPGMILVCGRYEGFDERIRIGLADEEISIGDYVVAGGELPAMLLVEAVSRLIPGVVGAADSVEQDSFFAGLLDYPHYTRPPRFRDLETPEVLLSGDHEKIRLWRKTMALAATLDRRPDLLAAADLDGEAREILAALRFQRT